MKKRDIPMVDKTTSPINTAEDLLFLQERWVTADVPELYAQLKRIVSFDIEPRQGLLVMEFGTEDSDLLTETLTRFGCRLMPMED